jgi:rSAM/selenodomain-associated transferase 1
MTATAIIVIAKAPVAGRVKTRLCPPCTPPEAAALAAAALADTLDVVSATPAAARVLALDGPPGPWIPNGWVVVPQLGSGLDERLANAFAAVTGPALLIGMDTPQVSPTLLADAARALHAPNVDAVLGPAADGGWWLIGLHRADARAFLGVPMSTGHTGACQLGRLQDLGLRTTMLPELRDIDAYADALAVSRMIPRSRFANALADLSAGLEDAG